MLSLFLLLILWGNSWIIIPVMLKDEPRRRNVVLFGPHDRYNFGDLLFTKVILRLLETQAGYRREEILMGGIRSVDMSHYGGEENILGMKSIQQLSRRDTKKGPYDIVYTGGEITTVKHEIAVTMMPDEAAKTLAKEEKIHECGYMIPKSLLVPLSEQAHPTNLAVLNSAGGGNRALPNPNQPHPCMEALRTTDYLSYRDYEPLYPDSAVMTKELYENEIQAAGKDVLRELFPKKNDTRKYIAIQHKIQHMTYNAPFEEELAASLDEVGRHSKATIVFFAAGTAPGHDSFNYLKRVQSHMNEASILYEAENVWKVVALISQAEAVLSTSLHVRIMAFIHFKPRVTWCSEPKHMKFLELWDADDSARCLKYRNETWKVLKDYYGTNAKISQDKTKVVYGETVKQYLENFHRWSRLLRPQQ